MYHSASNSIGCWNYIHSTCFRLLLSKFCENEVNRKLRTRKDEGRKTEEKAKQPEHQTRQHYVR